MSWVFMAFACGWLVARCYYAFFPKSWNSWEWSDNKWWRAYHRLCCKVCPRKHHCADWKKQKENK